MLEFITAMSFMSILGWVATGVLMLAWAFKVGSRKFLTLCLLSNVLWVWFAVLGEGTASLIVINVWMFGRGLMDLRNTFAVEEDEVEELIQDIEKERLDV